MKSQNMQEAREIVESNEFVYAQEFNREDMILMISVALSKAEARGREEQKEIDAKAMCDGCNFSQPQMHEEELQHHRQPKATKDYWFPCSAKAIHSQGERV